jgi:hypothetical protein
VASQLYKKTLERAVQLRGVDAMAARLAVPRPQVVAWMNDGNYPPGVFLHVTEVLTEHNLQSLQIALKGRNK